MLTTNTYASNRLTVGVGGFGVFDDKSRASLKASYEFKKFEDYWFIRPNVNLIIIDTGAYFVSVGGIKEFSINNHWRWGINFSAGAFHESNNDDEYNLDHDVEFYTALSLSYQLPNDTSIRAELGHISNAGLGENNPGSELIIVSYVTSF